MFSRRFLFGLILTLSFLLHWLLWQGVSYVVLFLPVQSAELAPQSETQSQAIDVELKSYVRQVEVPEEAKVERLPEKSEHQVDLLSERVQRVLRETRAALSGLSRNRYTFQEPTASAQEGEFFPQSLRAPSRFGNHLNRDIPLGNMTVLNTDQFVYYSFYSRIEELVQEGWQRSVQALERVLPPSVILSTPRTGWVTQAEFVLDSEGRLLKSHILKSSGVKELDWVAVQSFESVRFFPNPPQGMIQEDGQVHVAFSFIVQYRTQVLGER